MIGVVADDAKRLRRQMTTAVTRGDSDDWKRQVAQSRAVWRVWRRWRRRLWRVTHLTCATCIQNLGGGVSRFYYTGLTLWRCFSN